MVVNSTPSNAMFAALNPPPMSGLQYFGALIWITVLSFFAAKACQQLHLAKFGRPSFQLEMAKNFWQFVLNFTIWPAIIIVGFTGWSIHDGTAGIVIPLMIYAGLFGLLSQHMIRRLYPPT